MKPSAVRRRGQRDQMSEDRIIKFKRGAKISRNAIIRAAEESMFGMGNPGFCIACGEEREGCEPDAANYECYDCEEMAVHGAESLMMLVC